LIQATEGRYPLSWDPLQTGVNKRAFFPNDHCVDAPGKVIYFGKPLTIADLNQAQLDPERVATPAWGFTPEDLDPTLPLSSFYTGYFLVFSFYLVRVHGVGKSSVTSRAQWQLQLNSLYSDSTEEKIWRSSPIA
jgi:hypothetical protein